MTPAVRLLKKAKIEFNLFEYEHDSKNTNFGEEAAAKLNKPRGQVFKTLLFDCQRSNKIGVAVIPIDCHLDLKIIAKLAGIKKIKMADPKIAENITGYLVGGISPLGQKRKLPTYIDISAENFTTIFVSGGRRGLDIEIKPKDLIDLTSASLKSISK